MLPSTRRRVGIVKVPEPPTIKDGRFARVSRGFLQWHAFSFAMIDICKPDFAVIVGAAGDWTRSLVDSVVTRAWDQRKCRFEVPTTNIHENIL